MISLPDVIQAVCNETHMPMVHAVFGDPGVSAAFQIMETVRNLYKFIEPSRVTGRVVVYCQVTANATSVPQGPAVDFAGFANRSLADIAFEIESDGRVYERNLDFQKLDELANSGVVYQNSHGNEEFMAGSQRKVVPRLDPSAQSQFCVPTLSSLSEGLQHYARENVRESTCYIFQQAWHDANRIFFKAAPETTMRRSLTQFLRNRLGGDHDVWPEQNVNEKNPVDIRVSPRFTNNRLMLIEIKWLGVSVAEDGHITARYANPRAQEGADQLAEYLDEQRQFAPSRVIHGYYVIIDGRRHEIKAGVTVISTANGMHFENLDLVFNPAQHSLRQDFDPPYRMFARPICND